MKCVAFEPIAFVLRACFCFVSIASCCVADENAQAKQQLDAEKLFDSQHLMVVEIEIAQQDWDLLRAQSRVFANALTKTTAESPFTNFKANIVIDGVRIEDVGIRKKGFLGSLDVDRPSLKIDFSEYKKQSPVKGLDRLTLNNNKQDRSLISQFMTYKLFAESGQPASRCSHAKVSVNGEYLGIYSHVESIRSPMLERVFGDDSGELYEGTVADFFPASVEKFEPKDKKTKLAPIQKIAEVLDAEELDLDRLGELVDIDAFLKFWATESLVGFWDGYTQNQNNFFVYRNADNKKLYFLPWGTDAAFVNVMPLPPYVLKVKSVHTQAMLPNRLYQIPEIRDRYRATLVKLLGELWVEEKLLLTLDQVEAKLKDHLHATQKDFPRELAKARDFVKNRRAVLQKELDKWPIVLTHGPREPAYFKVIGQAKGTFDTKWGENSPAEPVSSGTAQLELVLDNETVKFKQLGVSAEPAKFPGPTDNAGRKPPTVVFTGLRESDGQQFVLGVGMDSSDFRPTIGDPFVAQGLLIEGKFGILNPAGYKFLSGTAKFEAAGREVGAAVRGSLDLKIVRLAGGQAKYIRRGSTTDGTNAPGSEPAPAK